MSKLIKKVLIVTCLALVFSLAACDCSYYLYHNANKEKEVISVELINYDNLTAKNNPIEKYSLDLEKLEILDTLFVDNIDSFISEISEIGGLAGKFKQVLNSPVGVGVRIIYNDDSFTLITVTVVNDEERVFLGEYDVNLNLGRTFGITWQEMIDDFKTLINKYFTVQVE